MHRAAGAGGDAFRIASLALLTKSGKLWLRDGGQFAVIAAISPPGGLLPNFRAAERVWRALVPAQERPGAADSPPVLPFTLTPSDRRKLLRYKVVATKSPSVKGRQAMAHNYAINDDVHHQLQGPQGRAGVKQRSIYTIVTCLPIEADGRPRYRIKSKTENIERVVTEEQISRLG
jgi:hypothetical protein